MSLYEQKLVMNVYYQKLRKYLIAKRMSLHARKLVKSADDARNNFMKDFFLAGTPRYLPVVLKLTQVRFSCQIRRLNQEYHLTCQWL